MFSDVSEAGFASVAYLRMVKDDGTASSLFIATKTPVAPRKQVLTRKLVLQGAIMSAHLANTILFLHQDASNWPSCRGVSAVPPDDENLRKAAVSNIVCLTQSTDITSHFPV